MVVRFDIVPCVITGHMHYGLLFVTDAGEPGYVDTVEIADPLPVRREWPTIGERLEIVAIATRQDGRIQGTVRASDLRFAGHVGNPELMRELWSGLLDGGRDDEASVEAFLRDEDVVEFLVWKLSGGPWNAGHGLARELLARAPASTRERVESVLKELR